MDNVDICQRPQPRLHVIPGDLSKAHAVHTLSYLISGEGSEAPEKRISKKNCIEGGEKKHSCAAIFLAFYS